MEAGAAPYSTLDFKKTSIGWIVVLWVNSRQLPRGSEIPPADIKRLLLAGLPEVMTVDVDDIGVHYKCPGPANIIDSEGCGVYEPRLHRPHVPLPFGVRQAKQWEMDCYYFTNQLSFASDVLSISANKTVAVNVSVWQAYSLYSSSGDGVFVDPEYV